MTIFKNKINYHSLGGFGADRGMDTFLNQAGGYQSAHDIYESDIIIFNGGADIGTSLYNEKPISNSIPEWASGRDRYESDVFNKFEGKKFLLGICRGSQFLNVMNGGSLWQDVNNHGRTHEILDLDSGKAYMATSTHHQQMRPNYDDGELVAVASESTCKRRDGEIITVDPKKMSGLDVEIMWYPKTRSLCIQGHPEYNPGSVFADYCLGLIHKFYHLTKETVNA